MINMTKLMKVIVTDYLLFCGLSVNALLLGIYCYDSSIISLVYEKGQNVMQMGGDSGSPLNRQNQLTKDIATNFGQWQPLPNFKPVTAGKIGIDDAVYDTLDEAMAYLQDDQVMVIGSGSYEKPLVIKNNNVTIIGSGRVVFDGANAEGKAAIVVKGNQVSINNIECENITVEDQNGACIRSEGGNLSVDHVYFHDSEQGILANGNQNLQITNSRFERLGKFGRAHGVYVGGGELTIENSQFIASVSEGHEIKSRARKTVIKNSVIASLGGDDSRLVDVPNGGELLIMDSVLEKGPQSINSTAIGYGLEGIKHDKNSITLMKNVIILERKGRNILLDNRKNDVPTKTVGNIVVTEDVVNMKGLNWLYSTRKEAGIAPYPSLPVLEAN